MAALWLTERLPRALWLFVLIARPALAHKHHQNLSEEEQRAPVDAILWIHMAVQLLVWGVIFPIGMVLGITRSRWHVPLQSTGFALTTAGYILGHSHKGRQFLPSVHGTFASILLLPITLQFVLGVYLKLHIQEKTVRPYAVRAHSVLGKAYPILGWTQMLMGVVTFFSICRGSHLGQCLAHYIMGSAFIGYGTVLAIVLLAGEEWMRSIGKSPEWWDSWVITVWGVVNTFTEHRGSVWSAKDMQHTSLGILWWTGGALGVYLARNNQRTVIPAVIIILTGWAMSDHAQALMISTKVHAVFGYTLMLAGVTRVVEICFVSSNNDVVKEAPPPPIDSDRHSDRTLTADSNADGAKLSVVKPFRHLPPFLLVAAGLLFISATDEELDNAHNIDMGHVTYILLMLSLAFTIYAFIIFLINLWATSGRNSPTAYRQSSARNSEEEQEEAKWYQPVSNGDGSSDAEVLTPTFVIGDER